MPSSSPPPRSSPTPLEPSRSRRTACYPSASSSSSSSTSTAYNTAATAANMQTRSSVARSTVSLSPEVSKPAAKASTRSTSTTLARRTGSPEITLALPRNPRTGSRRLRNECSVHPYPSLIDLTETTPVAPPNAASSSVERCESETPTAKRRKTSATTKQSQPAILIDDDEDNEVSTLLEKNRTELVESQGEIDGPGGKNKRVVGFTCIICLEDDSTNLSVTPCGHMFCHTCLFGAIIASTATNNKPHGRCPVCRGKVLVKDMVSMEFKKLTKAQGKQKTPS